MTQQEGNSHGSHEPTEQDRAARLRQLAHDLRNHLYVIGLSVSVLQRKVPVENELKELIQKLEDEQKQAVNVLDEVLLLARQEDGQ